MSPKKTILRALAQAPSTETGVAYTRPAQIPGFSRDPERFQQAVNALLKERLIEGRKDDEGHMALAVNPHRMADVRRTLRPAWAHPALWAAMAVGAGAAGIGLL